MLLAFEPGADLLNPAVIGLIRGAIYGLLGLGLVLLYKSNKIFNFAQGEFGTVAAFMAIGLASGAGPLPDLPYPVAAFLGISMGVLTAVTTERLVIKPLFRQPRVTLVVASAGVALLLIALQLVIIGGELLIFPPAIAGTAFTLGSLPVQNQELLILVMLGVLGFGAYLFFTRTRYGVAIIAVSEEPTATSLVGVSVDKVSMLTWGLAGFLGGTAGVLLAPTTLASPGFMTFNLLIPAFAAAVLGGISSLPGAFVGRPGGRHGGAVRSQALRPARPPGHPRRRPDRHLRGAPHRAARPTRRDPRQGGLMTATYSAAGARAVAVEKPYRLTPSLLALRLLVLLLPLYLVFVFPLSSEDHADLASRAVIFAIIGLSLNVLIGYTGQLSLGHQGLLGIGAFGTGYALSELGMPFVLTFVVAIVATAVAALLLGLVALRVSGLYLALITLVFGATAEASLFQFNFLTNGGAGQPAPRPDFLLTNVRFYVLCLACLVVVLYLDFRLTRSKTGRALLALKENERVAAAFGINVTAYKLIAFTFTGAITGLAGALFAYKTQSVNGIDFNFYLALTFVLMTVVGGLGSRIGVVIGSAFFAVHQRGALRSGQPGRPGHRRAVRDGLAVRAVGDRRPAAPADPDLQPGRHRPADPTDHAVARRQAVLAARRGRLRPRKCGGLQCPCLRSATCRSASAACRRSRTSPSRSTSSRSSA